MNTLAYLLYSLPSGITAPCCDVHSVDPEDSEVVQQPRTPIHHFNSSVEIRTLPLPEEQTSEADQSLSNISN